MFLPKVIEQNRNNAKAGIASIIIILSDQDLGRRMEKAAASALVRGQKKARTEERMSRGRCLSVAAR
jgi:hypothetical protein